MKDKWEDTLFYEKISAIIISVILVVMAFSLIFLSGGSLITIYQGMSLIFFILMIITLLMIYIRVSEIKYKEVKK